MKRLRNGFTAILFLAVLLENTTGMPIRSSAATQGEKTQEEVELEETGCTEIERTESEKELDGSLHAKAAVLIDMDSGRILYEKNGSEVLPMASTTKIMTCITALEEGNMEDTVTVSAYAAGQPEVHLGMQKGMTYRMRDLLYSLMLESHNDSAVAIAEHIGGKELELPPEKERTREESMQAVKVFCDKMTEKAKKLGCENTRFLTPNGLDAEAAEKDGEIIRHSTTAAELALMMRYCITGSEMREAFLEITREPTYSFTDTEGKKNYFCTNHNALLTMLEEAVSGKTGFTSKAGYCYVGALKQGDKQFALALLACGWPGHKNWKWEDCRNLFSYGLEQYEYREFMPEVEFSPVRIINGAAESGNPWEEVMADAQKKEAGIELRLLTREGESVETEVKIEKQMQAPIEQGKEVGSITYRLRDESGRSWKLGCEGLYINRKIEKRNFLYMIRYIWRNFLL